MVYSVFLKECLNLTHFREFGGDFTSFLSLPETVTSEMQFSHFLHKIIIKRVACVFELVLVPT